MELILGDLVNLKIETGHGLTLITGPITGLGYVIDKPDAQWFEIAGLTSRFYTDEEIEIKKVG